MVAQQLISPAPELGNGVVASDSIEVADAVAPIDEVEKIGRRCGAAHGLDPNRPPALSSLALV
jgi:hypothetical protein